MDIQASIEQPREAVEPLTFEQAWDSLKQWLSQAEIASGLDTSAISDATGIPRKRLARCLSRRRDEVLTLTELKTISGVLNQSVDAGTLAAAAQHDVAGFNRPGKPQRFSARLPAEGPGIGRPAWQEAAIVHCRSHILHVGGAHASCAWAHAQTRSPSLISRGEFENFISSLPRFEWLDATHTWFWFGYLRGTNHVVELALKTLVLANEPVSIEALHGAAARCKPTEKLEPDMSIVMPMTVMARLLNGCAGIVESEGRFEIVHEPGSMDYPEHCPSHAVATGTGLDWIDQG